MQEIILENISKNILHKSLHIAMSISYFIKYFNPLLIYHFQGSETTALQSAHAMLLLAMHPKIQDRVVEELREVFYNDEVPVDYESITKLTYLERVIKESLRLCPVVRK